MVPNPIGNVGALVSKGEMNAGQGFAIEFFIVFALVLVVFAAACDDFNAPNVKGSAPLAIGLAVVIGHLFAVSMHYQERKKETYLKVFESDLFIFYFFKKQFNNFNACVSG